MQLSPTHLSLTNSDFENFSRNQRSGNILQNLAEVQLFMDITWPNNIIIDDEAMHTYKKINRFLVQLKFTQVRFSERFDVFSLLKFESKCKIDQFSFVEIFV